MVDHKNAARDELLAAQQERDQLVLFDSESAPMDWQKEWIGMPEFRMGNTEPIQKITVNFKSLDDVRAFANLIGQRITSRTDSVWFPKIDTYIAPKNYRYVDES